jgi:hypothetical protein
MNGQPGGGLGGSGMNGTGQGGSALHNASNSGNGTGNGQGTPSGGSAGQGNSGQGSAGQGSAGQGAAGQAASGQPGGAAGSPGSSAGGPGPAGGTQGGGYPGGTSQQFGSTNPSQQGTSSMSTSMANAAAGQGGAPTTRQYGDLNQKSPLTSGGVPSDEPTPINTPTPKREPPKSLASTQGKDWAVIRQGRGTSGVTRPVRMRVNGNQLVLLADPTINEPEKVIPINNDTGAGDSPIWCNRSRSASTSGASRARDCTGAPSSCSKSRPMARLASRTCSIYSTTAAGSYDASNSDVLL